MTEPAASVRAQVFTATGHRHPWARIGGRPELEDWPDDQPGLAPEIDPTARVSAFCSVDAGAREPTRIGARSWLLQHVHIGHDAQIGADVVIATGSIIGGHARVEDGARLGVGAIILPFRTVGEGARIGAGAVVTHNVPAGETWAGNPARRLEHRDPRPFSKRANPMPESPPPGFGIPETKASDEIIL